MADLKLPYGLRGDELIYIGDVERGLSCDCICPACHYPLIARKGQYTAHHFAHYKGSTCEYGVETALHMAAKKVLETEGIIHLPALEITFKGYKKPWGLPEQWIEFDTIQLEKRVSNIVPDILVYVGSRPLMIEIFVKHRTDEDKIAKIRQLGISTIEIDISFLSQSFDEELLRDFVVRRVEHKRWLYSAKEAQIRAQIRQVSDVRPLIQRNQMDYVEDCPKHAHGRRGKSYTNVGNECVYCDYCIDITELTCSGRSKVNTYDDLRAVLNHG